MTPAELEAQQWRLAPADELRILPRGWQWWLAAAVVFVLFLVLF